MASVLGQGLQVPRLVLGGAARPIEVHRVAELPDHGLYSAPSYFSLSLSLACVIFSGDAAEDGDADAGAGGGADRGAVLH